MQRCLGAWDKGGNRMKRRAVGALGLGLAIFTASCGGTARHAITGHMTLSGLDVLNGTPGLKVGADCYGAGGYDDIHEGTSVSVANQDGKIIATGQLGAGSIVAFHTCSLPFTVKDVPDAKFFKVTISHRGELVYSKDELSGKGWVVEASLG